MKAKNINKLIDALESGKFKKCQGALHSTPKGKRQDFTVSECNRNTAHCCLGVAECIMPEKSRWEDTSPNGSYLSNTVASKRYEAIKKWLGLDHDHLVSLAVLNDKTKTFKKVIAHLKGFLDE